MVYLAKNGGTKEAPTGFSWTTLFFGFLPAFIRGDIKWGLIMLGVAFLTGGLSWLIFPFLYNKIYIKSLIEMGYTPRDKSDNLTLKSMGVYDEDLLDNAVKTVSNVGTNNTNAKVHETIDPTEELKKWQQLYKDEAITQEEYNKKKSEILKRS